MGRKIKSEVKDFRKYVYEVYYEGGVLKIIREMPPFLGRLCEYHSYTEYRVAVDSKVLSALFCSVAPMCAMESQRALLPRVSN
jgi:hypothetical protein